MLCLCVRSFTQRASERLHSFGIHAATADVYTALDPAGVVSVRQSVPPRAAAARTDRYVAREHTHNTHTHGNQYMNTTIFPRYLPLV